MRILLSPLIFSSCVLMAQPEKVLAEWKNDAALRYATYGYCVADVRTVGAGPRASLTEPHSQITSM